MKIIRFFSLVIVVTLACTEGALAQCFTVTPYTETYITSTSDGTYVYADAQIDGYAQMTFTCISPAGVYHMAVASGRLISNSGARSQGGYYSNQGCPSCYVSSTDNETIAIGQDTSWSFEYELEYVCSAAGTLASFFNFLNIELAYTKSKWNGTFTSVLGGGVQCFVTQWCTVASQPPLCNPSYVIQEPFIVGQQASCSQYYNTKWLAEKFSGQPTWACFPLLPGQNAIGTTDSSVAACTKHP